MKIAFYCFSGTGNTLRVTEKLKEELQRNGHTAEIFPIAAEESFAKTEEFDEIVVCYPVHAFNAPAPVLRFLKTMPKGGKKPCFLLRTSGEPLGFNHASGILPKRILRRRGYDIKGELFYVMPYNIIFRHSDGMAARMELAAEKRALSDAESLEKGEGKVFSNGPIRRLVSFVLRIEHPAMKAIGRRFKVTKECVSCGKCARVCPQGNIGMKDGKPKFGKNCAGCMGCSFACPKDAIRIGILNGWRVNGAYSFSGEPAKDEEVCDYCKKSYLRYFHEIGV